MRITSYGHGPSDLSSRFRKTTAAKEGVLERGANNQSGHELLGRSHEPNWRKSDPPESCTTGVSPGSRRATNEGSNQPMETIILGAIVTLVVGIILLAIEYGIIKKFWK